MSKVKKELKEFQQFKENYTFKQLELDYKDDQVFYGECLIKDAEGNILAEHEAFINVGYKFKGAKPKLLSNLYPYEFKFRGKKVASIEGIFQGIKFKNKKEQNYVLKYSRLDSNNIKECNLLNWKDDHKLYWQGKPMDRFSKEYDDFLDELYVSAIQNPLYRNLLLSIDKYILHSIGTLEKSETVFTRYEFERMLNTLVAYLKQKQKN